MPLKIVFRELKPRIRKMKRKTAEVKNNRRQWEMKLRNNFLKQSEKMGQQETKVKWEAQSRRPIVQNGLDPGRETSFEN